MDLDYSQIIARTLLTRRNFIGGLAGSFGAAAVSGTYLRCVEPAWFDVTSTNVSLPPRLAPRVECPLRVLRLNDLHAYRHWVSRTHIAGAGALGLTQKPDVICLTGDFITERYGDFDEYGNVMRRIAAAGPDLRLRLPLPQSGTARCDSCSITTRMRK